MCQPKADKTKEKGSQHNLKNVADKKETPKGGGRQNAEKLFVTMADVVALLEQEKAKMPKERFHSRRPPYPIRLLNKPYIDKYRHLTFSQYDGRKDNTIKHVSKFLDTLGPYSDEDLCLCEFSNT